MPKELLEFMGGGIDQSHFIRMCAMRSQHGNHRMRLRPGAEDAEFSLGCPTPHGGEADCLACAPDVVELRQCSYPLG